MGKNKSYDKLYLILMVQWLLGREITSVGTLHSNRKEISAEIKLIKEISAKQSSQQRHVGLM